MSRTPPSRFSLRKKRPNSPEICISGDFGRFRATSGAQNRPKSAPNSPEMPEIYFGRSKYDFRAFFFFFFFFFSPQKISNFSNFSSRGRALVNPPFGQTGVIWGPELSPRKSGRCARFARATPCQCGEVRRFLPSEQNRGAGGEGEPQVVVVSAF